MTPLTFCQNFRIQILLAALVIISTCLPAVAQKSPVAAKSVQLVVLRGTTQQSFSVPTIEVKSEIDAVSAITDAEQNLVGPLGILGIEIDQRVLSMAKGLRGPYGIIVAARAAGATTEVPLLVGDVIRDLNGKPMNTLDTLRSTLRSLPAGAPVTLQLQREGKLIYLSFTLD
jgi:S1-C subfamily serine protease